MLSASPTAVLPNAAANAGQYASDHILVRFQDNVTPFALAGTKVGAIQNPVPNLYAINLIAGTTVDQALAEYRLDKHVNYAETDLVLTTAWTPNDPQFNQQWDLQSTAKGGINATAAWGITTNATSVPIAVFDTGVDYTNKDLYLNIWINQKEIPASRLKNLKDYFNDGYISMRDLNDPRNQGIGKITDINNNGYIDGGDLIAPMIKDAKGNDTGMGGWADGISQDGSGYIDDIIGWNSNTNTNNPMDGYGHGTHVAGTIGASGNNGTGISGIAWQAQIVPVKFFDDNGQGTITQFIAGLNWALEHNIKISNNSWNDGGYTPALYDAIALAQSKGHLFIAAAGNNGRNTDTQPAYPADFPLSNVVSVGATDQHDNLASWSNYGKNSVDIAAPGVNIYSTLPGNQYGLKSGTSMATPHVTAVAALIWSLRPEWTYQQVINQLLLTADRLPSLTGKVKSGELDMLAALKVPPRSFTTSTATGTTQGNGVASRASTSSLKTSSVDDVESVATSIASNVSAGGTFILHTTSAVPLFVTMTGTSAPLPSPKVATADALFDNGLSLVNPADLIGASLHHSTQPPESEIAKSQSSLSEDEES